MKPSAHLVPDSVLRNWLADRRVSWLAFSLGIPALMLVGLLAATWLDAPARLQHLMPLDFINPFMAAYILWVEYPLERLTQNALASLRALTPLSDAEYVALVQHESRRRGRWERLVMLLGAAFGVFLVWDTGWRNVSWLAAYSAATLAIVFALLARALYGTIGDTRLVQRLTERVVFYSLFQPDAFQPVALWSLGGTLAFLVGIAFSALFIPLPALLALRGLLLAYAVIAALAVGNFLFNLRGTNVVMSATKERELAQARHALETTYAALHVASEQGDLSQVSALANKVTALVQYEQRIAVAPVWPYTPGILRRLAISILLPAASTAIRLLPSFLEGRQP